MLNNFPSKTPPYHYIAQENGQTNDNIGYYQLKEVFLPYITLAKKSKYRLLILDSYKSHINDEFEEIAAKNKVILATLPPYTLDVL